MKKIIWLSVNIMILLYLLYLSTKGTDWGMVFAFIMYAITFPIGFVVSYIYMFIDKYTDINMVYFRESYPIVEGIILPWSLFLIVGYIQWFVLNTKNKKVVEEEKTELTINAFITYNCFKRSISNSFSLMFTRLLLS